MCTVTVVSAEPAATVVETTAEFNANRAVIEINDVIAMFLSTAQITSYFFRRLSLFSSRLASTRTMWGGDNDLNQSLSARPSPRGPSAEAKFISVTLYA